MKDVSDPHLPRLLTRRQTLRLGADMGMGTLVGTGAYRSTLAQGTSQAAGDDYARPEALVDAAWLQQHKDDPSLVTVGFMPVEEFNVSHILGSARISAPELEVIDTSADRRVSLWVSQRWTSHLPHSCE